MSLLRLFVFGVLVCVLSPPSSSWAEGSGSEPAGYREAIDSALEEIQLGNFVEAREQFARAHALYPNARTLRGLGISEFELKHYSLAADHLTRALASDVRPLEGSLRRETEALLARTNTYVGEIEVRVAPKNATLLVDGARKASLAGGPLRLEVGDHILEFSAQGYATERRQVTVHSGRNESVEVRLAALGSGAKEAPAGLPGSSSGERSEGTPAYKRWWVWTIVGVVVAGAAVGTVLALNAQKKDAEYHAIPSAQTPPGAGLQPLWRH